MNIRERIREWLGITDLRAEVSMLDNSLMSLHRKTDKVTGTLNAIGPGLGRVIAKLEPKFTESEFDPARKAESDRIADEVIKRLEAEAKARAPYQT